MKREHPISLKCIFVTIFYGKGDPQLKPFYTLANFNFYIIPVW